MAIVEGLPAGLPVTAAFVDAQLARRMQGYGRGARMQIEQDRIEWLGGVRSGETLGSPVAMRIANRDWANWKDVMDPEGVPGEHRRRQVTRPRPGHADLVGVVKQSLHLPDDELAHRCEQTIRNYDPCISCATHFLKLEIERT